MPEPISIEAVSLLQYILPGFVVGWVIYSLTTYERPTQFQQLIEALIFTALIQGTVVFYKNFLSSEFYNKNTNEVALMHSIVFGVIISILINNDFPHRVLRYLRITSQTTHPSEWAAVLISRKTYIVLHLVGERRIYGWPKEWPQSPKNGHFFLLNYSWLLDDGGETIVADNQEDGILIPACDVNMIEVVSASGNDGQAVIKPTTT